MEVADLELAVEVQPNVSKEPVVGVREVLQGSTGKVVGVRTCETGVRGFGRWVDERVQRRRVRDK